MSVKKKDRHVSKQEATQKSRKLVHQLLIITRPEMYDKTGKVIRKAGLLGKGQPFQVFGLEILHLAKLIHSYCYQASQINLKDKATLDKRNEYHKKALEQCYSILRQLDLCIFEYAQKSKKKRKSFGYVAYLTSDTVSSIQDRLNRDKLIYEQGYKEKPVKVRRYR